MGSIFLAVLAYRLIVVKKKKKRRWRDWGKQSFSSKQ